MREVAFGQSDVGLVRKKNQDAFGIFPELGLYIVADGMGGRPAGEVASQMTVEVLKDFFFEVKQDRTEEWDNPEKRSGLIQEGILRANKKVFDASEENAAYRGMGTTVVVFSGGTVCFVGDSRAYLYREGKLIQITQDHSVVNEYIRLGIITPEAARSHSLRHVLSRGVGVSAVVLPETVEEPAQAGDIFLLCTDGLSNMLNQEEMHTIFVKTKKISDLPNALIDGAKEKGGKDNITVILIAFEP